MAKRFPLNPAKPHLICWGCDRYCPADSMACGNGSVRAQHPAKLFGEDWHEWGMDATSGVGDQVSSTPTSSQVDSTSREP